MRHRIAVTVNGRRHEAEVEPRTLLSDFLRHGLGLTGTNVGCEHGVCGACTVQLDEEPVRSCLMLAVQANGSSIRTVEALAEGDRLHPLQQAFMDAHGLQCGFCTPGFLMSIEPFLRENPDPEREGDPGGARRQPLPLHGLRGDRGGGEARRRAPRASAGRLGLSGPRTPGNRGLSSPLTLPDSAARPSGRRPGSMPPKRPDRG